LEETNSLVEDTVSQNYFFPKVFSLFTRLKDHVFRNAYPTIHIKLVLK